MQRAAIINRLDFGGFGETSRNNWLKNQIKSKRLRAQSRSYKHKYFYNETQAIAI